MSIEKKQNKSVSQKPSNKIFSDSDELRLLDSHYILGACLVQSTTGDIYAAWDVAIGIESLSNSASYDFPPQFFIKVLPDDFLDFNKIGQTIEDEVKQLTGCFDWCKVKAFEENAEAAYLVLQLPRGDFFSKQLTPKKVYGNLSDVLPLLNGINKTLTILKKCGIRHGRVEPDSIYITENGDIGLVDSIYVAAKQYQLEQDIDYAATIPNKEALYASPDICFGRKVSEQDDVFSLASICYRLLSGEHPFGGVNSVSALLNKIRPAPISTLSDDQWKNLEYGLSLAKDNRQQTLTEFINGFDLTSKPLKPLERKKREDEATAARKAAQDLMNKQVKKPKVVLTKPIQPTKKPSIKKTLSPQLPFADLDETDSNAWSWILLSLFSGVVTGMVTMLIAIHYFGLSFSSLLAMMKHLF